MNNCNRPVDADIHFSVVKAKNEAQKWQSVHQMRDSMSDTINNEIATIISGEHSKQSTISGEAHCPGSSKEVLLPVAVPLAHILPGCWRPCYGIWRNFDANPWSRAKPMSRSSIYIKTRNTCGYYCAMSWSISDLHVSHGAATSQTVSMRPRRLGFRGSTRNPDGSPRFGTEEPLAPRARELKSSAAGEMGPSITIDLSV